ncbi:MAG: hypothetical protein Q7R35_04250 [Elusimicrobiota bacterium]|nr:hypothetical protein [Elusimicrobiota bacterium]
MKEKYPEAEKAWSGAVGLGPDSHWGKKSGTSLLEVRKILKRIREIETH